MVKFFCAPGSCSLAPHILLVDSGIDFETKSIDVIKGEAWPDDYVQRNPNKQVPFIELESGVVIKENVAVQTLITQLAPKKQYFGDTDLEVVRTYEWLAFLSGELHAKGYSPFFRPERFTVDQSAESGVRERAREKIEECYRYIEGRIEQRQPINHVLAVEAYLFVFFRWGNGHGFHIKEKYPKFYLRMAQFAQLAAVKKALADEGIEATI